LRIFFNPAEIHVFESYMSYLNGEDSPFEMESSKMWWNKNIEIIYPKTNSIKIKIYAYVDTYSQIYHTSDEKHLLKLVPQYLAPKKH